MDLEQRVAGLSAAVERQRLRHQALVERVDGVTRRLDRVEIRLLVYSMVGAASGAIVGSAGSAAARSMLGW